MTNAAGDQVVGIAFSPDSTRLAVAYSSALAIWQMDQDLSLGPKPSVKLPNTIKGLTFNPAGTLLALARTDGALMLVDANSGGRIGTDFTLDTANSSNTVLTSEILQFGFTPDGQTVYATDGATRFSWLLRGWMAPEERACDLANRNLQPADLPYDWQALSAEGLDKVGCANSTN
jgi:hypothetical protein